MAGEDFEELAEPEVSVSTASQLRGKGITVNRSLTVDEGGEFKYTETVLSSDPNSQLQHVVKFFDERVGESLNASPAHKLIGERGLPYLPETTVTGYSDGSPEPVLC